VIVVPLTVNTLVHKSEALSIPTNIALSVSSLANLGDTAAAQVLKEVIEVTSVPKVITLAEILPHLKHGVHAQAHELYVNNTLLVSIAITSALVASKPLQDEFSCIGVHTVTTVPLTVNGTPITVAQAT
jgi:hypothetical protein